MVASIPASTLVDIFPNVIDVGGSGLDLTALILTNSTRSPIGLIVRFPSAAAVSAYFGPSSVEYGLATIYFDGFDNSSAKPGAISFSQYPTVAVAAYLRGGLPLSLAALTAMSGTITMTIEGRSVTSGTISLGSATSMSQVAALVQTGLNDFSVVGTAQQAATTLTVTAVTSGAIQIGMLVTGSGFLPNTRITAFGTGTGGAGTYTVSTSSSVASQAFQAGMTAVTYDSLSGSFVITTGSTGPGSTITVAGGSLATALALTTATGAVTSQGAAIATPAAAMNAIVAQTGNFATFLTAFKPSTADMLLFAAWNAGQDSGYVYLAWDADAAETTSSDTTSVGYLVRQANLSGTANIYDPANGATVAAAMAGAIASLNYAQTNGRRALAYLSSPNLAPGVTDATIAANLIANGYNFYGAYASRANGFIMFQNGQISGKFSWIDSYVNQIKLNDALQVALITLLQNVRVPYNNVGYTLIETAMAGPVQDALNFGSITPGVTLSSTQIATINAAAGGRNIADTIRERGWYILVSDPGPTVRAKRGSPIVFLFYADGQAVQTIVVTSDDIK